MANTTYDIIDYTEKLNSVFSKYSNIATVESSSTASKAYSVNDYLVYNGLLYKVTASISSGGTITPGTNVSATKITDELGEGVPSGGTVGQIIIKNSSTDGDAGWQSLDSSPTANSTKPVTSGGIKSAVDAKASLTVTTTDPGEGSALAANTLLIVVEA